MKIFIFGANGMLGSYISKYIDSVQITRKDIDASKILQMRKRLNVINPVRGDVIINCIGITNKQRKSKRSFFIVNSLFPKLLADYCEDRGVNMIHISTDCVFSGKDGGYDEYSIPDELSVYGLSKSSGEPDNCSVIRTSIIGENRNSDLDLLEWVRKHKGKEINGWVNHFWNGVTCLQFAKICKELIDNKDFHFKLRHYFSETVSKAELIEMINDIYELGIKVNKVETDICDRTLTSRFDCTMPSLRKQIIEQKQFNI